MITPLLAHGFAGEADEYAIILLGISLIAYMAAIWLGDRRAKRNKPSEPPDENVTVE